MKAKLVRQDYLVPLGPVDFGVAMPSIIESADGDLVAVWYAGSINPQSYDPHNADSSVYYARLEKGAAHWTAPEVLDQSPELVHASTAAMRDNAGRIWALYKFRTLEGTWNDSGSGLAARRSSDGGRTWTPEQIIDLQPQGRVATNGLALPNGDLLLPVTMEMTDRYFGECSVFISEDGGETWSRYGEIKADDGTLLREPSIFIRGDGVIQMYMRSCGPGREWSYFPPDKPGRMWESHSNDNGRTWSKARRTTLPNNESTVDALELPSGTQIVCYNNTTNPDWQARWPLNLAYSTDRGETWEDFAVVHPGPGYICHPSVILGSDERLHVVHTCNYPTVRYACYELEE